MQDVCASAQDTDLLLVLWFILASRGRILLCTYFGLDDGIVAAAYERRAVFSYGMGAADVAGA